MAAILRIAAISLPAYPRRKAANSVLIRDPGLNGASEACDRCVAALTVRAVVALP